VWAKRKRETPKAKNAKETTTKHWEKGNNSNKEVLTERRERKRVRGMSACGKQSKSFAQTKEKQKRLAQNQMHHTLSLVLVYSGAFICQCLFSLFPALFPFSNFISTETNSHPLPPPGTRAASSLQHPCSLLFFQRFSRHDCCQIHVLVLIYP